MVGRQVGRRLGGWLFLAGGLLLGLAGLLRGESGDVLLKAVNVCLECIGLR